MSTTSVTSTPSGSVSSTGTISSAGVGSGLNVSAIISSLMAVEDIPLTNLQSAATQIQTTISAYGSVQSALSTFQTAAQKLTDPSTWSATIGTSSNQATATVSTTSGAAPGAYAVQIQNLATSQSTVSGTYTSANAPVGSGTLQIQLGSWSTGQTAFTPQSGSSSVSITVNPGDTLTTLADNINAAGAGVAASIVTDASGARLVLTSSTTGATNGFQITATDSVSGDNGTTGLSSLGYNPPAGATSTSITQSAANANATINGLAVTSATNTLSNVLQGLTVNLLQASTSPVQLTVAADTTSMTAAVNGFVTAYNSLDTLLNTDTAYSAANATAGPLQGAMPVVTLQRQLQNIMGSPSTTSTAFSTLSQIGLQVQTDGTLSVNSATLTNAMGNTAELKKLFTATDLTGSPLSSGNGYAQQFVSLCSSVLGYDGLISTAVTGLNTDLTRNQTDQANEQTILASTQANLQAQYSALDTQMSTISTLSQFVQQQITTWNKSS